MAPCDRALRGAFGALLGLLPVCSDGSGDWRLRRRKGVRRREGCDSHEKSVAFPNWVCRLGQCRLSRRANDVHRVVRDGSRETRNLSEDRQDTTPATLDAADIQFCRTQVCLACILRMRCCGSGTWFPLHCSLARILLYYTVCTTRESRPPRGNADGSLQRSIAIPYGVSAIINCCHRPPRDLSRRLSDGDEAGRPATPPCDNS